MKKFFMLALALTFSCGAFLANGNSFNNAYQAKAESTLPNQVYYLNTMDYAGVDGKFGDWYINGGVAISKEVDFSNSTAKDHWVEQYLASPNLVDLVDKKLDKGFGLSFDAYWPFTFDWSKIFVSFKTSTNELIANYQRNADTKVYAWITTGAHSNWANSFEQGGYMGVFPTLIDNTMMNFKAAITPEGYFNLYIDNALAVSNHLGDLGFTIDTLTEIIIYVRNLNNTEASTQVVLDNLLIDSFVSGDITTGTRNSMPLAGNYTTDVDHYVCNVYDNTYLRHLAFDRSFAFDGYVKLQEDSKFCLRTYFMNGTDLGASDTSISVQFGYDAINNRCFGDVAYITGGEWKLEYFGLNGELKVQQWQKYIVTFTNERIIVNVDGAELFNKTFAALGIKSVHAMVIDGTTYTPTLHIVNEAGTIRLRDLNFARVTDKVSSISDDYALLYEVSTFVTSYMSNRSVVGGVYSICDLLNNKSALGELIASYDALSDNAKAVLDATYDGVHYTVGQTISYLKAEQSKTLGAKYPSAFDHIMNNQTLIIVLTLGVLSLIGLFILRSKKIKQ